MRNDANVVSPLQVQSLPSPVSWDSALGAAVFKTGTAGVGPLLNVVDDLQMKAGCTANSWWAGGYFSAAGQVIGYIYNPLLLNTPQGAVLVENVSLTNATTGAYFSGSQAYPLTQATVSSTGLDIVSATGSLRGDFDDLHAVATMDGGSFDVHLRAASPAIFNGGTGRFPLGGMDAHQYSVPVLATVGGVTLGNQTYEVHGNSWFDRQWGTVESPTKEKWTWFGINLTSGEALSVWSAYDKTIGKERSFATILHKDGSQTVAAANITADRNYVWRSPATGNTYLLKWTIEIPQFDTVLTIVASPNNQEFTMQSFGGGFEGVSSVTGTFKGKTATGAARLELLGG